MIGEHLLRYQKNQKLIIADKETEGLHLAKSRPWQVAMLIFHGDTLVKEINMYPWWPDLNVSPGAAAATRFNWDNYKSRAEDPKKCHKVWRDYINDPEYLIVYHNGLGYDSMVGSTWEREIGVEPNYDWLDRLIDTNCVAKAMKKGIKPDISSRKAFRRWQFTMSNLIQKGLKTNLTALGKEFQIPFDYATLHEGVNDTHLNKLVLDKLKWTVEI